MIRPLLILLEGANDLEFLVRIATRLQSDLPNVPDLGQLQAAGHIVLVPLGGGNAASWPDRFRPLGLPEFHLYDKEQQPETDVRLRAVAQVNARPGCHAALTSKRCLENYLHPQAVAAAGGGQLAFGDDDAVSILVARHRFEQTSLSVPWDGLARRSQRRLSAQAKRWLNRVAVEQMSAELLAERDPSGELLGWLHIIQELVTGGSMTLRLLPSTPSLPRSRVLAQRAVGGHSRYSISSRRRPLPMPLSERLSEYVRACFTGIWIESHEHEDAIQEIAQLCQQESWRLATWDLEQGLRVGGAQSAADAGSHDPLAAIRSVNSLAAEDSSAVLVLVNFHRFLQSAEIVQALAKQLTSGKQNRTFVMILSPIVQVPTELEKLFVVIEHPLPSREQLEAIARGVATENHELPSGVELQRLLDAAAGLTRVEAENAFSLSLVRHSRLQVETLWELKSQTLKKSGLLTLHRGGERFDDLGGLEALKAFCKRALRGSAAGSLVKPRGVLLLSPPGCGKSQFCKALGNETGRPTLVLDVGSLLGSLVGQSEANIRQALRIIDAMAPAVCFLDEVEKAFSGVSSSGQTDSGVSARLFGSFLSWLNDHESDVFVVATANDITKLPPEFSRAERFDSVFFLDLPDTQQRAAIWQIYIGQYRLDAKQKLPPDSDWTGAEIKACCRLSALLDMPLIAAAQNIVPVARTSAESVEKLRQWASGRCLSADQGGIYAANTAAPSGRRRVSRGSVDPRNN